MSSEMSSPQPSAQAWVQRSAPMVARFRLFQMMEELLQAMSASVMDWQGRTPSLLIDESTNFHMHLERGTWRLVRSSDNFKLDVSLRMADVRVGFCLPSSMGLSLVDMESSAGFAEDQADKPTRRWRLMDDGRIHVEYAYSNQRFADLVLYSRAMTGDAQALALMADGLALEVMHLYESLNLLVCAGAHDRKSTEIMKLRFRTSLTLEELCRRFEINPSELECLEEGTMISPFGLWLITSSPEIIEAIKGAIESDPESFQRENRMRVAVGDNGTFGLVQRESSARMDREPARGSGIAHSPASRPDPRDEGIRSFPAIDVDQIGSGGRF